MPFKPLTLQQNPSRILVVPLRYIGDTILTVPLLRNLKHAFPEAELDVLVSKTAAPLLEPCPYITELHIEPRGAFNMLDFLKLHDYDLVVILRKSFTMAFYCRWSGVPQIVGYDKQRFPWGYKRWGVGLHGYAEYPSLRTEMPQAVSHLQFMAVLGQPIQDQYLELWTTPEDEQAVDNLLKAQGVDLSKKLAVVHTVSASHGKSIKPERFLPAIEQLLEKDYQVLFSGIESDKAGYEELLLDHPQLISCRNLAGLTSLRQTVALYKRIEVLLTVDSSPMHMALAVGVPKILTVYGPTNEKQWGVYEGVQPDKMPEFAPVFNDLPCRPCYAKTCEHNNCRVELSENHIVQGLAALKI